MLWDNLKQFIAVIYDKNNKGVGTGFATSDGLFITCAHVVRDALDLGKPTPIKAPDKNQLLKAKFSFHKDQPEFNFYILEKGWFPRSFLDDNSDPIKDIAILKTDKKHELFLKAPDLNSYSMRGKASISILGFPSARLTHTREIEGKTRQVYGVDNLLEVDPDCSPDSELGGISGSPMIHENFENWCGMVAANWTDGNLTIRVLPSPHLRKVVSKLKDDLTGHKGAGEQYLQTGQQKAKQQKLKNWHQSAKRSLADEKQNILKYSQEMRDHLKPVQNQLPEDFPYIYLEMNLDALDSLLSKTDECDFERLIEFIEVIIDFDLSLTSFASDVAVDVELIETFGKHLTSCLKESNVHFNAHFEVASSDWPPGHKTKIREIVENLQQANRPLLENGETQRAAQQIQDYSQTIEIETYNPKPKWSRMNNAALKIQEATQNFKQKGSFEGVQTATTQLKQHLQNLYHLRISNLQHLQSFKDLPFAPEMVIIPPGTFLMGSPDGKGDEDEHPQHEVTIANSFAIGKYPVTFSEYDHFCDVTGRKKPGDEDLGRVRRPAINVSWHDAVGYCKWLSDVTGAEYRLLSEAEWEYACRAGSTTDYYFGDDKNQLGDYAWYHENSGNETHPVGEKKANDFGLHDMHGNVWEWCEDHWHESYHGAPDDGTARLNKDADNDAPRVLRGGSWHSYDPENLRSAYRGRNYANVRNSSIGFRVARTLFTP